MLLALSTHCVSGVAGSIQKSPPGALRRTDSARVSGCSPSGAAPRPLSAAIRPSIRSRAMRTSAGRRHADAHAPRHGLDQQALLGVSRRARGACGPAAVGAGRSRRRRRRLGVAAVGQGRPRAGRARRAPARARRAGRLGKPGCGLPRRRQRRASGPLAGATGRAGNGGAGARAAAAAAVPAAAVAPAAASRPARWLGDRRGRRLQRAARARRRRPSARPAPPRAPSPRTWPPRWRRSGPRSRPARRARLGWSAASADGFSGAGAGGASWSAAGSGLAVATPRALLDAGTCGGQDVLGRLRRPGARRRTMPARRRLQAPARSVGGSADCAGWRVGPSGRRSRRRRLGVSASAAPWCWPAAGRGWPPRRSCRAPSAGRPPALLPSPTMAASTMAPSICCRRDCWAADAAACSTRSSSASGRGSAPAFAAHVLQQPAQVARDVGASRARSTLADCRISAASASSVRASSRCSSVTSPVRLLAREAVRPLQALAQIGRHRNRPELLRKGLRHQRAPGCGAECPRGTCGSATGRTRHAGMARQAHPFKSRAV